MESDCFVLGNDAIIANGNNQANFRIVSSKLMCILLNFLILKLTFTNTRTYLTAATNEIKQREGSVIRCNLALLATSNATLLLKDAN